MWNETAISALGYHTRDKCLKWNNIKVHKQNYLYTEACPWGVDIPMQNDPSKCPFTHFFLIDISNSTAHIWKGTNPILVVWQVQYTANSGKIYFFSIMVRLAWFLIITIQLNPKMNIPNPNHTILHLPSLLMFVDAC